MPELSTNSVSIVEIDSSFEYVYVRVSLDEPATAQGEFFYYTQERDAEGGSDYQSLSGSATFNQGDSFVDVRIAIYGDPDVEGDERFDFVILPGANITLPDGAPAMKATVTISDNDDGIPDVPAGDVGPGILIAGPDAEAGLLPTLTVRGVSVIEADSSFEYAYFLVTLDRPATAPVTFNYHTQEGTAKGNSDFNEVASSVTIPAGRQSTWVRVAVYGDNLAEGNEDFQLVVTNVGNAVFTGGAEMIAATATIIGDDLGPVSEQGQIGEQAEEVQGPDAFSFLPTVRFLDVSVIEGDSSFNYAYIPYVMDKAASAPVTLSYYSQSKSASAAQGDYDEVSSTLTIPAGSESGYIRIAVYGDNAIEGDEAFNVVFNGIQNGNFEGGAAATVSTVTILDNDAGPVSTSAGLGGAADPVPVPVATTPSKPVVQVSDVSVYEGDSSFTYAEFLITLDRPAPAQITGFYTFEDGSASVAAGDFDDARGTFTIAAGLQSTFLRVAVYGDNAIEGNEEFQLVLSGLQNANFVGNAPAIVATGTIIENDAGAPSLEAGIGGTNELVVGPEVSDSGILFDAVSTSVWEGDSSFIYANVYVLLSEPATTAVSVSWQTVQSGGATEDVDFDQVSGTVTIAAGTSSTYVRVAVYGDVNFESPESFEIEFSSPTGASFANGLSTTSATVTIIDNDGGGGTASGPAFVTTPAPNGDANYLLGTSLEDTIKGFNGDDTIFALESNDYIEAGNGKDEVYADTGNDTILGGSGDDTLMGDQGNDLIEGGLGKDSIDGGTGTDTASYANATGGVVVKLNKDEATGSDGLDRITSIENLIGSDFNDKFVGTAIQNVFDTGAGNDIVFTRGGDDVVDTGIGNDTVYGDNGSEEIDLGDGDDFARTKAGDDEIILGQGDDRVAAGVGADTAFGGDGNDTFFMGSQNDFAFGGAGEDVLNGGFNADVLDGGADDDRVRGEAGVDQINGGDGNDLLNGGANADTFWFFDTDETGVDRITDFEDGLDEINLSDWGFANDAAVIALASSSGGANQHTRIDFTDGSSGQTRALVIENLDITDFDASDITLSGTDPFVF
ncbi:MAG: Calx-beta domain-containing protein [Paracoccaceae bacterium]